MGQMSLHIHLLWRRGLAVPTFNKALQSENFRCALTLPQSAALGERRKFLVSLAVRKNKDAYLSVQTVT